MAYGMQAAVPTIWNEMERPTPGRMLTVYLVGLGLSAVMYAIVAGCGYATYGSNVASNILTSYPSTPLTDTARIGLSVVVLFSYPIMIFLSRISAASLYLTFKDCCSGKVPGKAAFPGEPKAYDKKTVIQTKLSVYELTPIYLIPSLCFIGFTAVIGCEYIY